MITPTCTLIRRGDTYLLALNEDGNDAAQIGIHELERVAGALVALVAMERGDVRTDRWEASDD